MSDETLPEDKSLFVDRRAMLKALAEHNASVGFIHLLSSTAQHARELMLAQGIRAEDNAGTREMLALRYPDERG